MATKRTQPTPPADSAVTHRDVDIVELRAALERARTAPLSAEDYALLTGTVDTFTALTRELQLKGMTLERLRRLFLGGESEKTKKVLGDDETAAKKDESESAVSSKGTDEKQKRKGHGRNGAEAYTGAKREKVEHAMMHSGDA